MTEQLQAEMQTDAGVQSLIQSLTDTQRLAAAMLGRGKTRRSVARRLEVTERTISRWRNIPGFAEEEQRVRVNSSSADPRHVLIDALSARDDDGINWTARLKAAFALLGDKTELPDDGEDDSLMVIRVPRKPVLLSE